MIGRLGDRLLALVVPEVEAEAADCRLESCGCRSCDRVYRKRGPASCRHGCNLIVENACCA